MPAEREDEPPVGWAGRTSSESVEGEESARAQPRTKTPPAASRAPFDPAEGIVQRWWLPLAAAVLGLIVGLIAVSTRADRYRASSVAAVTPSSAVQSTDLLRSVDSLERRTVVATAAELVSTSPTRRQAGLTAADEAGYSMEARVIPNTSLVRVTVEGSDPARVAAIANQTPRVLSGQLRQLFRVYDVQTVAQADQSATLVSAGAWRSAATGGVAGLLLGALAAITLHLLSRSGR